MKLGRGGLEVACLAMVCCSGGDGRSPAAPDEAAGTALVCQQDFGDPAASDYVLPFRSGLSYRLIQGYCPPNPNWGHHGWIAYDFDLQIGDTVIASRAGRVEFVRENNPDGTRRCGVGEENFVAIEHTDGTVMQYVHLTTEGALVEVDDRIEAGQPVGLSGDSGCSSGPHLHVVLLADRFSFDAASSRPLNYRNAEGPVDARGGLVFEGVYRAGGG